MKNYGNIQTTRPSVVPIMEGQRTVGSVRVGSWGPLKGECALIESYNASGRLTGPYTIDYLPGGMWKVFRRDVFMRYADSEAVKAMSHHIALGEGHIFEEMAQQTEAEQPDRGDYGPQPAACKWIEEHDEVLVTYMGSDENWPTGCWQIQHDGGEQFVNEKQLLAIAKQLGMTNVPKSWAENMKYRSRQIRKGEALDEAFGIIIGEEEPYPELDEAFAGPATDEWADLEGAFG